MDGFETFANCIAERWNLPWLRHESESEQHEDGPRITFKLPSGIDDVPLALQNPRSSQWASVSGRMWIQTQQIEQAFAGKSVIDVDFLRSLCIRISRQLHSLLQAGVSPRLDTSPFVEWDPREFNSLADHAANVALDLGQDWLQENGDHLGTTNTASCNLRLCIDGARRGTGASAAGLAHIAYLHMIAGTS